MHTSALPTWAALMAPFMLFIASSCTLGVVESTPQQTPPRALRIGLAYLMVMACLSIVAIAWHDELSRGVLETIGSICFVSTFAQAMPVADAGFREQPPGYPRAAELLLQVINLLLLLASGVRVLSYIPSSKHQNQLDLSTYAMLVAGVIGVALLGWIIKMLFGRWSSRRKLPVEASGT